jgi:NAD(P)-dependent dehydrogenase (short-subunit alcohol dehydrogenase family)
MAEPCLKNKRALVTGAGRGIGRACALALAQEGADVAIAARGEADLRSLAEKIEGLGRKAIVCACDVTDSNQVALLSRITLEAFGRLDILVNSAGSAAAHSFPDHPDEIWHQMLAVNMTGTYYVTKSVVAAMIAQRSGRIINIASTASRIGARYIVAYTAAKHGVLGFTRALAMELVVHGVTVNAVCPGFADTSLTQISIDRIVEATGRSRAEARKALEQKSPQNRLIAPEEVAAAVVFLARDSSHGINGQAINIDGGEVQA